MNRLVFCKSLFILIFLVQTAHTATTCSLSLQSSVLDSLRRDKAALATERFGDGAKSATSNIPEFSLFQQRASSYDYDALSIFTQEVKDTEPRRIDDFRVPIFWADAGHNMITGHFRHSGVYSHDDYHSKRNSWFPTGRIEGIDTTFTKNDSTSNPRTLILTNYQGWIPDVEYDIIDVVPAPGTIILGGLGIGTIGWMRRRRTL